MKFSVNKIGEYFALKSPMITKIFLYLLVITTLVVLPEAFWEKVRCWLQSSFDNLRKKATLLGLKREQIPLWGEILCGEELLNFFPQLEAKIAQGQKTMTVAVPKFKFYTTLLIDLIEAHRKVGVSLKLILPELRENLIKELQFEKRLLGLVVGGNLQFLIVVITTWGFIALSSQLAEIPLRLNNLITIAIVQLLAFLVFNLSFLKMRARGLERYSQGLEQLYFFNGMVEVGLPVNQVLGESGVLDGALSKHKTFSHCFLRLYNLVNRWKENGLSPKFETQEIIREIWHLKEIGYQRFLKHLELLKFIILAFFFLPAYFFYLYSIFQFFMEQ